MASPAVQPPAGYTLISGASPPSNGAIQPPAGYTLLPDEQVSFPLAQPAPERYTAEKAIAQGLPQLITAESPVYKTGKAYAEGQGLQALIDIADAEIPYGTPAEIEASKARAKAATRAIEQMFQAEPGRVWGELSRSGQAMVQGQPGAAAWHLAGAVPLFGPATQQAAQDLARRDPAAFIGHLAALLTPFVAEKVGGAVGSATEPVTAAVKDATARAVRSMAAEPAVAAITGAPAQVARLAGSALGTAADIARSPLAAKVVGIKFPGAANLMRTGRHLFDAFEAGRTALADAREAAAYPEGILDGLAQSQLGKSYKNATAEEQAAIRGLADRIQNPPAATAARPAPAETAPAAAAEPAPAAALTADDALLLKYLGVANPDAASAETIAITRQFAAQHPEILGQLRAGGAGAPAVETGPGEAPAGQAPYLTVGQGALEYNAPGAAPEAPPAAPAPEMPAHLRTHEAQAAAQELEASMRAGGVETRVPATEEPAAPEAPQNPPGMRFMEPDEIARYEARKAAGEFTPELLTTFIQRNKIPTSMVAQFGPEEWRLVAERAGVPPPTIDHIATITKNLAEYDQAGVIPPGETEAGFAAKRAARNKRKPAAVETKPAAVETGITAQKPDAQKAAQALADAMQESGTAAPPPGPAGPPAPTASEARVEAIAQHLAGSAIVAEDIASMTAGSPERAVFEQLSQVLGLRRPTAAEIQKVADRMTELRGEAAAGGAPAPEDLGYNVPGRGMRSAEVAKARRDQAAAAVNDLFAELHQKKYGGRSTWPRYPEGEGPPEGPQTVTAGEFMKGETATEGAAVETGAAQTSSELVAPKVPDAPRPLKKTYGPNWESRPDAAELRKEFRKQTAARARGLKLYRKYVDELNARYYAEQARGVQSETVPVIP